MIKLITSLFAVLALGLSGCAILQSPGLTQAVIAAATSEVLAHIAPAQQKIVARDINMASGLYNALAGPEGVPSPDQFALALQRYLPEDSAKALASSTLMSLYVSYYPYIAKHSPKDQLAQLAMLLAGLKAGAVGYL